MNNPLKDTSLPNPSQEESALSFEAALAELEKIVHRLEEANLPLEESILAYERGEYLKRYCEKLLALAEQRIEKIVLTSEGQPTGALPLDASFEGSPLT